MHIEIVRERRFPDSIGVFGRLIVDGEFFSMCVENGDTLISVGSYGLIPHDSPKHPQTVAFVNHDLGVFHQPEDVPHDYKGHARTDCLIHSANWPLQLEGCCAPGETIARFPQQGMGVTNSVRTMGKLRALWKDRQGLTATIRSEL